MNDEHNIEHKRWRLEMKVVGKVPLCHSRKVCGDDDDFWMIDCDLDYGHAGIHEHKGGPAWPRDEDDPEITK